MFNETIIKNLLQAEAKALATTGPHGVNVVPVSVINVKESTIYLYDFFMGKTVANLSDSPAVALTAWSGLQGVQIKAVADYCTNGPEFEQAVIAMKEQFPERTLRGLIILTPIVVYDISAGLDTAGVVLAGSDGTVMEGQG